MNAKKLILTGLSVFCFGASLLAQDSRGKQEFKDGMEDEDHAVMIKTKDMSLYSRNLLSLMPFQFTENGVGVGLSWEYTLDHDGYLALYLPVMATFNPNNDHDHYTVNGSSNDMLFYAMPGVKFYPTGLGKVKYAVGPSAVIAVGQKDVNYGYYGPYYYNPPYTTYPAYAYESKTHFKLGMLINNSLNINPTPRLHVGVELGLGFTYIDRVGDFNDGVNTLVQGNFNIGYRF